MGILFSKIVLCLGLLRIKKKPNSSSNPLICLLIHIIFVIVDARWDCFPFWVLCLFYLLFSFTNIFLAFFMIAKIQFIIRLSDSMEIPNI